VAIAGLRERARAGADIGDGFRAVAIGVGADEAAPVPGAEVQALVGEAVALVAGDGERQGRRLGAGEGLEGAVKRLLDAAQPIVAPVGLGADGGELRHHGVGVGLAGLALLGLDLGHLDEAFDLVGGAMNRQLLEKPFAPAQIRQRKGRNGLLDYVEGQSVIQRLNGALEGQWSFEVVHHEIREEEVLVLGRLTAENRREDGLRHEPGDAGARERQGRLPRG
jgi:hypothetical protein